MITISAYCTKRSSQRAQRRVGRPKEPWVTHPVGLDLSVLGS